MSEAPRTTAPSPTLEDVARVAGVSRATVSRVVNGTRNVGPAIQETVRTAVAATGYAPNRAARSLVTRRSGSIALVVSGAGRGRGAGASVHEVFTDPFFGRVVAGVVSRLRPHGMHPVLMFAGASDEDADGTGERGGDGAGTREDVVSFLRRGDADGALIVSTHADDPLPALVTAAGVPAVLFARPAPAAPISFVDLAHREGGRLAAEQLLGRGCRRVVTVCGPRDVPAARERLAGFAETMARHGQPRPPTAEGDFTQHGGEAAMRGLLAEHPELDGVFAANDLMAQGACLVLRDGGRRVPEDVALVGFDDSSAALACRPRLTTVRQPVEEMAAEMARLLVERIGRPELPVVSTVFDPVLVVRQSG